MARPAAARLGRRARRAPHGRGSSRRDRLRHPLVGARMAQPGPGFVHGGSEPFPVWWTALPPRAPMLTGWAGGPRAAALTGRGEAAMLRAALDSLASVFGRDVGGAAVPLAPGLRARLVGRSVRGRRVQLRGRREPSRLARRSSQPIEDTLFLAGEAVAGEGGNATVHGALASGRRAAAQVMDGGLTGRAWNRQGAGGVLPVHFRPPPPRPSHDRTSGRSSSGTMGSSAWPTGSTRSCWSA